MKKVVSTALFGEPEQYGVYLPSWILAALNLFPQDEGFSVRVHVDDGVAKSRRGQFLARLAENGLVDLRVMGPRPPRCRGMIWRAAPVFDEDAGWVFCRDLDAVPMPRDRAACEQFMLSRAAIGTVHDSMSHAGICGGLCHFLAPLFREQTGLTSLDALVAFGGLSDEAWDQHGADQNVLNRLVDRVGGPILFEHRYGGWFCGAPGTQRREAGRYQCEAWSTPVPDQGVSKFEGDLARVADALGNHLGCAGYDYEMARRFYLDHGRADVAAAVVACEEAVR